MNNRLTNLIRSKFVADVLCNYVSFGILAISGIAINLIIAKYYGAASLGRFNIVYSIYIVASQFCTCGIHYSILKHLAAKTCNNKDISKIICTGITLVIFLSVVIILILSICANLIGILFKNPIIASGIKYMVPALLFFAVNKLLLAVFNGLRSMRIYAFGQAVRYLLMGSFVLCIAIFKNNEVYLNLNYLFAEIILSLLLLALLLREIKGLTLSFTKSWLVEHLRFGLKGFLVGIFVELNTRIDVLILGAFVSNTTVGVYGFIAMLVEGLYQFLIVIKNNINPILARHVAEDKLAALAILLKKIRVVSYGLMFLLGTALFLIYPVIVMFLNKPDFAQGHILMFFLLMGLFISAGVLPFGDILIQAGHPGQQTIQTAMVISGNIILNLIFIYYWGALGCAIATALATYLLPMYYLNYLTKKYVGLDLFKLQKSSC